MMVGKTGDEENANQDCLEVKGQMKCDQTKHEVSEIIDKVMGIIEANDGFGTKEDYEAFCNVRNEEFSEKIEKNVATEERISPRVPEESDTVRKDPITECRVERIGSRDCEIEQSVNEVIQELVIGTDKALSNENLILDSSLPQKCFDSQKFIKDKSVEEKLQLKSEVQELIVELIDKVEHNLSPALDSDKGTKNSDSEVYEGCEHHIIKSIMKHGPCLCEKHVGFNTDPEVIRAFDAAKDFTVDIQIVEKLPKKVVSYKALFAQKKAEEELARTKENQDR